MTDTIVRQQDIVTQQQGSSVVRQQADVTLLLDLDGVIREATFSSSISGENAELWVGRRWIETVENLGTSNVKRMLDDARTAGISAFRQVTQRFPSGLELPMEYTTVLLGGRAGLLAIGKNQQAVAELQARLISAQQAMERDYWKLREVETRYRLLFDASYDAVLVLKAANLRIVEANPAALQALDLAPSERENPGGHDFLSTLQPQERDAFQALLLRVREQGKAPGMILHLGRDRRSWSVRASLMTSEPGAVFLVQLGPINAATSPTPRSNSVSVEELIEKAADGFVVIDQEGIIRNVNQAFLDLIEVGSKGSAIDQRLSRWLWRPGADVSVLLSHVNRQRFVRLFSTVIHGELGTDTEIEISAATSDGSSSGYVGLVLRDVSRRLHVSSESDSLRASLGSMTEQVGKTPLRKLVRNTVGVVERYYIKAALELAEGNRTAASEILGLSRQSLYAKLNRYGLEGEGETTSEE